MARMARLAKNGPQNPPTSRDHRSRHVFREFLLKNHDPRRGRHLRVQ